MEDLLESYQELFLRGAALRNMLVYMCNACTAEIHDPITHTLCTFLTTPIAVSITKTGLAPFKDCNMAIYPFFCMTAEQKALLLSMLECMQRNNQAILSTQMGGGGMAVFHSKSPRHYLDTVEVMTQFSIATRQHTSSGMSPLVRDNICNIIVQRVCSMVHIPRSTLNEVMERVRKHESGDDNRDDISTTLNTECKRCWSPDSICGTPCSDS